MHTENNNGKFLPVFLRMNGQKIVIIGAGKVALQKAKTLNSYPCKIEVVAPEIDHRFAHLSNVKTHVQMYNPSFLEGASLVYACTNNATLNEQIGHDAATKGILANICDNPPKCQFITPATLHKDEVCIAISSNGRDVRKAVSVRNQIAEQIESGAIDLDKIAEKTIYP